LYRPITGHLNDFFAETDGMSAQAIRPIAT
jgi:hypothetical protein